MDSQNENNQGQEQQPEIPAQQQYVPSYADNAVKTQKGMNWAVVSVLTAFLLAVIGGLVWWFMFRVGSVVEQDPDVLLLNVIGQVVTADDVRMEMALSQKTILALGGATVEEMSSGLGDYGVTAEDLILKMKAAIVQNEEGIPNSEYSFGLSSEDKGIEIGLEFRSIGETLFAQLAKFTVPTAPLNLSPLVGQWIKVNFAEIEQQFALGAGDAYEKPIDPMEYVEFDSGVYYDEFRSQYMTYRPFTVEKRVVGDRIELYPEINEQFKPFVMAVVPALGDILLADIDRAIEEHSANVADEDVVRALKEFRVETVSMLDDAKAELDSSLDDVVAEDGDLSFSALDETPEAKMLLEDSQFVVVLEAETGTLEAIRLDFKNEDVEIEPVVLQWTGINSGYTIAEPTTFMTIGEAMPVIMGVIFGGLQGDIFMPEGQQFEGEDFFGNMEVEGKSNLEVQQQLYSKDQFEEQYEFGGVDYPDTDGDGLFDYQEESLGTNTENPDTDGDGYDDFTEVVSGHDPLSAD